MRIAFIVIGNGRRSNYLNGYNLRYGGGGGSGTDTSSVLVAEYLAKQGNEVVFVTEDCDPLTEEENNEKGRTYIPGEEYYGVKYTNIRFDGIDNREFDILVNMLWFSEYDKLPITVTKTLIYWSHMQWTYGHTEMINFVKKNNISLGIINISQWERRMNANITLAIMKEVDIKTFLIPNPVMDEMITEVLASNPVRKSHKFIFHASWARGGDIALNAVRELNYLDTEFHSFDYLMTIYNHKDSFFNIHGGVDKSNLFTHIAESDYFIYPLYTPYQDVHKDTFSCVVAEAIALGAIVVTYPLGALPENFSGFCQWLDLPKGVNYKEIQGEPLTKDLDGKFTITNNIVDKIRYLEANPSIKEDVRNRGKDYILSNFSIDIIGEKWVEAIKCLVE